MFLVCCYWAYLWVDDSKSTVIIKEGFVKGTKTTTSNGFSVGKIPFSFAVSLPVSFIGSQ